MTLDNRNKKSKNIKPFEPFDIVFVDIHKTAAEEEIRCVKKRLDLTEDLKYVAISYRWGEIAENAVSTVDYEAHVISFGLRDFVRLCQAISKEVDLQSMNYMWVDAICIDQENMVKRKETIYHMNDIYLYANWILAVPDMNHDYLKNKMMHRDRLEEVGLYRDYIYHSMRGDHDQLQELYDEWMEKELKVPKNLRHLLSASVIPSDSNLSAKDQNTAKEESEMALFEQLMAPENVKTTEQSNGNGHLDSPCSAHKDIIQKTRQLQRQISKWQQALSERQRILAELFVFFGYFAEDWSTRTWVISEFSISQNKNDKPLKYWYTALHQCFYSLAPGSTFSFFELDWNYKMQSGVDDFLLKQRQYYSVTSDFMLKGEEFKYMFQYLVKTPGFLDMLLTSKTVRNVDRFHAVLPLSEEYRHHIKDKDTIGGWKITDMTTVRMRVRQWYTTKRNLHLLYEHKQRYDFSKTVSLPSFDAPLVEFDGWYREDLNEDLNGSVQYNFDLDQKHPGVVITDTANQSSCIENKENTPSIPQRYSMLLYPRIYQTKKISFQKSTSRCIRDNIWTELGLDPLVDSIAWVCIPLFFSPDDQLCEENRILQQEVSLPSGNRNIKLSNVLRLIGSHSKNIWLTISRHSPLLNENYIRSSDEWVWCQRTNNEAGFRVY